jgi:hypothetical protein
MMPVVTCVSNIVGSMALKDLHGVINITAKTDLHQSKELVNLG